MTRDIGELTLQNITVSIREYAVPGSEGEKVVSLGLFPHSTKFGDWPGFTICFDLAHWQQFVKFISELHAP